MRYQIAQKLHACTEPATDGRVNDRARDLHDLLLIEELGVGAQDLPGIREACVEIFGSRAKHGWPPLVSAPPGWGPIWEAIRVAEETTRTLSEAVADVTRLIATIDAADPSTETRESERAHHHVEPPGEPPRT